jgi:hypothetical protein
LSTSRKAFYSSIFDVLKKPCPSNNLCKLAFCDQYGKVLQTENFQNTNTGSFDISTLPKGIYIVSGVIDNKKMVTKISLQ